MRNTLFVLAIIVCSLSVQAVPVLKLLSPYATPDSGFVARGAVSFTVGVSSTLPVTKLEFYVDNVLVNTDSIYPYSYMWDTRTAVVGAHTLKAIAYDTQSSATLSQAITVNTALALKAVTKAAVTSALIPNITALISNVGLRDVSICLGADSAYYLTGAKSDMNIWYNNEGINLWRSYDLKTWTYIGLVWSFEGDASVTDQAWTLFYGKQFRAAWNTKIKYVEGNYYLSFGNPVIGSRLLKSTSGKPEGPYAYATIDPNLTNTTLFQDSLSKYTLYYELNNAGFLFKNAGKCYLASSRYDDLSKRFSSYVGVAGNVAGPFTNWYEALPCGTNACYFTDTQGGIWATLFGNDDNAPWREKPGIVKMMVDATGLLKVSTTQTLPPATVARRPIGLVAKPTSAQVTLNWTASAGAAAYHVKRSLTSGGAYTVIATVNSDLSYTDKALVNGKSYYYVVTAFNPANESVNSLEVKAVPSVITGDDAADALDFEIHVYPNPATNLITIDNTENAIVSIVHISGKSIRTILCKENVTKVDVSEFERGMYLLQIKKDGVVLTKKISIVR